MTPKIPNTPPKVTTQKQPYTAVQREQDQQKAMNCIFTENPDIAHNEKKKEALTDALMYSNYNLDELDTNQDGNISPDEAKKADNGIVGKWMNRDENGNIVKTSFTDMIKNAFKANVTGNYTVDQYIGDGTLFVRTEMKDNKRQYKTIYEGDDTVILEQYDEEENLLINDKQIIKDGTITKHESTFYNSDGTIREKLESINDDTYQKSTHYNSDGSISRTSIREGNFETVYNANGQKLEENTFRTGSILIHKEFNPDGTLNDEKSYDNNRYSYGYSGTVEYSGTVRYEGDVSYDGEVGYSGTVSYNGEVGYKGLEE